ncbi:MAG: sulfurtransferase complex subunit TusD [Gammaproteobacteria bacterium]|nr:sulfurtransferase complex subunit TusD [Gammaproteobacteria bacterium]
MNFTLIVHSTPDAGGGAHSALRFAEAAHRNGHHLQQVFFYHDGVMNALASRVSPQDESELLTAWQSLAASTGVQLAVCIAAASRRGVLDVGEAERLERFATLAPPFELAGLGQLIEAVMDGGPCITFVD